MPRRKVRFITEYIQSNHLTPILNELSFTEEQNKMMDINMTLVLYERQAMPYAIYRAINPEADDEEEVRHYATLAGRSTSERMLLYRE